MSVPVPVSYTHLYKVKAAKAEANIARYQLADAKEKVELQVSQASYKVNEAAKRLSMAEKNLEKADENLRYAKLGFMEGAVSYTHLDVYKRQEIYNTTRNKVFYR